MHSLCTDKQFSSPNIVQRRRWVARETGRVEKTGRVPEARRVIEREREEAMGRKRLFWSPELKWTDPSLSQYNFLSFAALNAYYNTSSRTINIIKPCAHDSTHALLNRGIERNWSHGALRNWCCYGQSIDLIPLHFHTYTHTQCIAQNLIISVFKFSFPMLVGHSYSSNNWYKALVFPFCPECHSLDPFALQQAQADNGFPHTGSEMPTSHMRCVFEHTLSTYYIIVILASIVMHQSKHNGQLIMLSLMAWERAVFVRMHECVSCYSVDRYQPVRRGHVAVIEFATTHTYTRAATSDRFVLRIGKSTWSQKSAVRLELDRDCVT